MDAHETTIYNAVLVTAAIIGGILAYLLISLIRHHRRTVRMQQRMITMEITTLEKERTRMAADLHDELGPILSAVKFKLASIEISETDDQLMLQQAGEHIDMIITRMRSISNDLMPNTLLRKGLVLAIEEFIHSVVISPGLEINFVHAGIPQLQQQVSINIYRILNEIIHNTIKHAKASKFSIELLVKSEKLIMIAADNGTGFDTRSVARTHNGHGLQNMLNRTEILGGNMYVDSISGKGTQVTIEIPLGLNKA